MFLVLCMNTHAENPVRSTNTLAVDATDLLVNENLAVSISMNNSDYITGLQFDITYPMVYKPYDNNYSLETRTKGMTVISRAIDDFTLRYFCYFMSNGGINAGNDKIMTLFLKVTGTDGNVPEGTYNISVKNIKMSATNLTNKYTGTDLSCSFKTWKSSSIKKGDANGDGKVNNNDVDITVSYIMTGNKNGFYFLNADMNTDKQINAADIVRIVKIKK